MAKGIGAIILLYLFTAAVCLLPVYHFESTVLIAPGLAYALPFAIIGWGLHRRREWGRKLALMMSFMLLLIVLPILTKKNPTFIFSIPYSVAITYPSSSASAFKGTFGTLILGHSIAALYLLSPPCRREFQKSFPEERPGETI